MAVALVLAGGQVYAANQDLRLVAAVKAGDPEGVRTLLKDRRINVNAPEADGATALAWAAYRDDAEVVQALIAAGANVNAANDLGITALALASANVDSPVAERLLAAGANPNSMSAAGETPLMIAARVGNVRAVEALLAKGAMPDLKERARQQTALMWAAAEGHSEVIQRLVKGGASVRARSARGWTPLMFGVASGNIESVRALVEAGAPVNDESPLDLTTPLHIAADSGAWPTDYQYWVLPRESDDVTRHEAVGLFLLEQGANPNASDGVGRRPLHAAARTHKLALAKGLLARGANPNARLVGNWPRLPGTLDDPTRLDLAGATPFLVAAKIPDLEMMRLLVGGGANPLLPAFDGTTPLMMVGGMGRVEGGITRPAESAKLVEAAQYLISLGDNVKAANTSGLTATHAAAFNGADDFIKVIAEGGAPLNSKDNQGRTPTDIAKGVLANASVLVHESTVRLLSELMTKAQ
jgi:ankyrin repeat protein